jgi:hypothetical protein|tara:strand:+ start:1083 stop:1433 length:351 start_codon:yes stop_codon:yes gene_type:complete
MEREFEIRDTKRKGDISEHYAVTWLWEQGYEVFKNSGCSGAIDLIAMDSEGNMTLIDVKTAKKDSRRKDKYVSVGGGNLRPDQKKLGVKHLVFYPKSKDCRFVEHRDKYERKKPYC